jgi:hypothetical protein
VWTNVHSAFVDRDVVIPNQIFTLFFGLQFDVNLRAQPSWWSMHFTLFPDGQGPPLGMTWTGWISQLPGNPFGNIWLSATWNPATNATGGRRGLFLYQPRAVFQTIGPGGALTGDDEFAVAEEDHYIIFE